MIPFVAAGGLLIALGFLFGGYQIVNPHPPRQRQPAPRTGCSTTPCSTCRSPRTEGSPTAVSRLPRRLVFTVLGQAAFGFLVPALAGYIAYAIADRPGIAPGFIVGAVSVRLNAGFIGGLIGGVIAGLAALWISR